MSLLLSLSTRARIRLYFDVSARGSGIKSVSGSYSNLNRQLDLLHHYIRPLGSGTTLGLHLFLDLCFHLFPQPMCHQLSQRSSGHPFRQTVTIATSCSIRPHGILAFTTSTFPSFYSSYILAHFQVFTVQSHATQLTTLCADERGYMSNTSCLLFPLPVIFVLDRLRRVGGGSDVFVWVFLKGHALIHSRKWEGYVFFRKKILKYPGPPSPIKNVPSLSFGIYIVFLC